MADDQTNPYTQLGMMGMMMPNPYTQYKGQLPMPGYMGTPTDAEGSPIASYGQAQQAHEAWEPPAQGTTMNSTPTAASWDPRTGPQGAANLADKPVMTSAGGVIPTGQNTGLDHPQYVPASYAYPQGPAPQQQQAAPAPTNPIDMRQAYLTALSNPGNPKMPGANVPEAQPLGTPSVLNSFLAAHPGGGTAAPAGGGYSNKGFFDTLNQLRSA